MCKLFNLLKEYNPEPFKLWLGPYFGVAILKPEDVQVITFLLH